MTTPTDTNNPYHVRRSNVHLQPAPIQTLVHARQNLKDVQDDLLRQADRVVSFSDAQFIREQLNLFATFPFASALSNTIWTPLLATRKNKAKQGLNLAALLKRFINPQVYGSEISAAAAAIKNRWDNNDWEPADPPFVILVDSGEEDAADEGLEEYHGYAPAAADLMRGVLCVKKNNRWNYEIERSFARPRKPAFFGDDNGSVKVGMWWPLQVCALRDGVHGSRQAGIYGNREKGCFSIVVSDAMLYDNRDSGEEILYCANDGTKGKEVKDKPSENGKDNDNDKDNDKPTEKATTPVTEDTKPPDTIKSRYLEKSLETGEAVRVLRAGGSPKYRGAFAPTCGIRYDGLYRVTMREMHRRNIEAGVPGIWRYKLVRLPGQRPLGELAGIPSQREIGLEKIIRTHG